METNPSETASRNPPPTAPLGAIGITRQSLDVTAISDGNHAFLILDQIFHRKVAGGSHDLTASGITIPLLNFAQITLMIPNCRSGRARISL